MDLDRILHEKKLFAELVDQDLEDFLRDRPFGREHLNLEFKVEFPYRSSKCDIREVCRYIVGFSNEEGGVVIYGVADNIKDDKVPFPEYVPGLKQHPSVEDLSLWVVDRVRPLVQSPAIRLFKVQNRTIAVLKIPEGVNRPYCYYDRAAKTLSFFKKTAGGIKELEPDEVSEIYRDAILDQSRRILKEAAVAGLAPAEVTGPTDRLAQYRKITIPKLEDVTNFGRIGIYCLPNKAVDISPEKLSQFVIENRSSFAETMRYYPDVESFQKGVAVGFYPRAIRQNIKSTSRVTLYRDGLVALDAQADITMDHDNILQPYWVAYEIQRHLQLAKALLKGEGVTRIHLIFELEHIENFSMRFDASRANEATSPYGGSHERIELDVEFADIYDHDGEQRNIAMPATREITDEVCRIFGFTKTLPGVWDSRGYLHYVKGLEYTR